ncbi:hypothetical protein AC578_622 [Pseudocercospora eumusae]|uniref:Arylsulfotransferase N-terminal domain-containing protein n=1 Tax=Pseudocercospora eumusae TaxID=321146 RepID=A0A139HFH6_9PEZI|nr:hypothetical protein AC578_622 [Pseudocercospora eumusae]
MLLPLSIILFASWATAESESPTIVPVQSFISRPDILVPSLDVRTYHSESISPGYIFFSTWSIDKSVDAQNAPYIFTNDGELVFAGYTPSLPATKYFNFQAHRFANGTRILSVFRGASEQGRGQGHIALFDDSYRLIRTIDAPDGGPLDFHEFQLLDDGKTAIVVGFRPVQADLSQFGIVEGLGWLLDSMFWVLDLEERGEDGKDVVKFAWRASEHIAAGEAYMPPTLRRMAGMSWKGAYDYCHINSVDRFANGDFLLSARHTNAMYRIDGKTGAIIWAFGGKRSSFNLLNFTFSSQHDARVVEEHDNGTEVVISFFNNAYNGVLRTSNSSSALVAQVATEREEARLLKQFFPAEEALAPNQGSEQRFDDGHTLVSWGLRAEFSEFDQDGKRILDVAFAEDGTRVYRVRKYGWIGKPLEDEIAVYLYARTSASKTFFWMSWNGATEVTAWRALREDGLILGQVEWEGFESCFESESFVGVGYVEAVGRDGKTLGRSTLVETFVPPENMADVCGDSHCTMQVLPSETGHVNAQSSAKSRKRMWLSGLGVAREMSWLSMVSGILIGVLIGRFRWRGIISIRPRILVKSMSL